MSGTNYKVELLAFCKTKLDFYKKKMGTRLLLLVLGLLGRIGRCEGHVKLFYAPYRWPIRNAASPEGDGAFSTSGPCGGVNTWGANGFSNVTNGQAFCAVINYNGGHKSPSNAFRAVFQCGKVGDEDEFEELDPLILIDGTSPAPDPGNLQVPAPQGNTVTEGYTLCFNLTVQDVQDANSDDRKCTISLMDQRFWGGCIDVNIVTQTLPPSLAPEIDITQELKDASGTYRVDPATDCDTLSGGNCCLDGYIGVSESGGISGRFSLVPHEGANAAVCPTVTVDVIEKLSSANDDLGTLITTFLLKFDDLEQEFLLSLRDAKTNNILITNVGELAPVVSDSWAIYESTLAEGISSNQIPDPSSGGGGLSTGSILLILAFVGVIFYIAGGIAYQKQRGDGTYSHPHRRKWGEFASLSKEGAMFTMAVARAKWNGENDNKYPTAPHPENGKPTMVSKLQQLSNIEQGWNGGETTNTCPPADVRGLPPFDQHTSAPHSSIPPPPQ